MGVKSVLLKETTWNIVLVRQYVLVIEKNKSELKYCILVSNNTLFTYTFDLIATFKPELGHSLYLNAFDNELKKYFSRLKLSEHSLDIHVYVIYSF